MGITEGAYWLDMVEFYVKYSSFDRTKYTPIKDCDVILSERAGVSVPWVECEDVDE